MVNFFQNEFHIKSPRCFRFQSKFEPALTSYYGIYDISMITCIWKVILDSRKHILDPMPISFSNFPCPAHLHSHLPYWYLVLNSHNHILSLLPHQISPHIHISSHYFPYPFPPLIPTSNDHIISLLLISIPTTNTHIISALPIIILFHYLPYSFPLPVHLYSPYFP